MTSNLRFAFALLVGLAAAGATPLAIAADTIPIQGTLWQRLSPAQKATLREPPPTISSTRKPSATVCPGKVCTVRVKGIYYFQQSDGKADCTMWFDPDVLVVTRERVKIRWVIDERDANEGQLPVTHEFKSAGDIKFVDQPWNATISAASTLEAALNFLDVETKGHGYNVTAWDKNQRRACLVDPLIVNTG